MRAQSFGWLAVLRAHLGEQREEIIWIFEEALQLYPGDEEIVNNYRAFLVLPDVTDETAPCSASDDLQEAMKSFHFDPKVEDEFLSAAYEGILAPV